MFQPTNTHVLHITTDELLTLLEIVKRYAKVETPRAEELILMGAIYVENIRVTENKEIKPGTYLRLHTTPRRYLVEGIDWKGRVVEETSEFVVIDKPPGVPVPSTVDNLFENVNYQLSKALNAPLYVTQRLDRPTSGLLVLAKTKEFQKKFNKLLMDRAVEKKYQAICKGSVKPGKHVHFIEDSKKVPKQVFEVATPGFQSAELVVLSSSPLAEGCSSHEIQLLTGRTHQIRAQFSHLGHPLLGDTPYGGEEIFSFTENAIALRSIELKFLQNSYRLQSLTLPS